MCTTDGTTMWKVFSFLPNKQLLRQRAWRVKRRRRSLHYQTARTKSILSIPLSPAALFAWVAATADLLGMLFRSMKIMKEIMDFPFSKLLAYTMCRESGLGERDRPPPTSASNGLIILLKAIHMANRLKQWMECQSYVCVCQHSRYTPALPPTHPRTPDWHVCLHRKDFPHTLLNIIIDCDGLGACKNAGAFTHIQQPLRHPQRDWAGEGERASRLSVCFLCFPQFFFLFPPSPWKINKTEAFWFASVFQQSSFRLDVLFGRRSRWRWRIRILSPFLLGPDLIFGRFYREIKSEKQKRENVRNAKFYTSQHCKDVVEW